MRLSNTLRGIVKHEVLEVPTSQGSLTLLDKAQGTTFTLSAVPSSTVLLRLAGSASHMSIVCNCCGRHRMCDYLLVSDNCSEARVFYIELTDTLNNKWSHKKTQVCRSLPFFEYLRAVGEVELCGVSFQNVTHHYLVLARQVSNGPDKQRTRPAGLEVRREQCHGVTVRGLVSIHIPFDRLLFP